MPKTQKNPKLRRWVFTLNNPTLTEQELLEALKSDVHVTYAHFQREQGKQGTEHYQGFILLKVSQRLSYCKKLIPRAHFEPMGGSLQQNIAYCSKEEGRVSGPYTCGELPSQGKRNDIVQGIALIQEGASFTSVVQECPSWRAYPKAYEKIQFESLAPRNVTTEEGVRCEWWFGTTGIGKSRRAHHLFPQAHYKEGTTKWWDGYRGEDTIVVEEFSSKITLTNLLRLCDRYGYRAETKGGHTEIQATTIILISNDPPWFFYPNASTARHDALRRRVKLKHFKHVCGGTGVCIADIPWPDIYPMLTPP